ncbi:MULTISPECIES: SLATT domain-containing protein [Sorangium]|uniref:Membrane protein n=1 Tax=Sorangium cellulosum (strain So ce56) TaxID=448385 RepID=A9FTS4_SORC5|nr:SLATT domain-containing protein [Sorangium cellulosum]CAN98560.1 putative membrane protein [Sorangium cellulosum So ce56]
MSDEIDAVRYAGKWRLHFEKKADHNKAEALICFTAVVACTLVAPVFVMLGEGFWLSKLAPSLLSLLAAGMTTWLQLRKPQQLWALYRTCQRRIEDLQAAHSFGFAGFERAADRDRLLAKRVAEIVMFSHEQWVPLVPSPENIGALTESRLRRAPDAEDGNA